MELEAKFAIDDPALFAALQRLAAIGPFALRPAEHPEDQHNTYFDTSTGALRDARYGLRVRQLADGRAMLTLKGNSRERDGLYERDEWEEPVMGVDPATWPAGTITALLRGVVGDAPLVPILVIRTHRIHLYAEDGGAAFAEISMDTGEIAAGGRTEPISELEVELLPGAPRTSFDTLVALLRDRFALQPERRSKLQRGLMLLAQIDEG